MSNYNQVFENNKQWAAAKGASNETFFEHLSKGQSPEFLYIGCADSRVPAAAIMGLEPGDVFVHRNVANVVSESDPNVNAVIQYAVAHLGVKHIVVCGHTECGGVKAAMGPALDGDLETWVGKIRSVKENHAAELNAIADENARYNRLIELNVQDQCDNILKNPAVAEALKGDNAPSVHGWLYSLSSGTLKDLGYDLDAGLSRVNG